MAIQKITADVISSDAITTASISDSAITAAKLAGTLDLTGKTITVATASSGDNDTSVASTAFVQQELASLVDSAPSTLNTLNELAAALGDDANFSTTVTNSIATKAPLATPQFTNRVGIGVAAHATAGLNITNTSQHIRLNNGSELGAITVLSTGELDIWGHGDGETINFRTGTGAGTVAMNVVGTNVGIGTTSPQAPLHARNGSSGVSSYTAGTRAIIEGTATTYLTLASPTTSNKGILFADSDDSDAGYITYDPTDNLDFGTAGSTRLRIDSSGNVGIGTTGPSTQLHVYDASSHSEIRVGTASSSDAAVPALSLNNTSVEWSLGIKADNHLHIRENTASYASRVVIADGGNVGIGVTSPSTMLHMNGTGDMIRLESTNSGAGGAQMDMLHFSPSGANEDTMAAINMGGYYSGSSSAYFGAIRCIATDLSARHGRLEFLTRDDAAFTTAMTISHLSKVGIGTTSPSSTLTVSGSIESLKDDTYGSNEGGQLVLRAPSNVTTAKRYNIDTFNVSAASVLRIFSEDDSNGANGVVHMAIHSSGCVGVGTLTDRSLGTNIGTLVVNGSAGGGLWLSPGDSSAMTSKIYAEANGSVGDLIINNGTGAGSGGIKIETNETQRMMIDSSGRLLINQASSNLTFGKLQVSAGGETAGHGGIVGFFDTDASVGSSNLIQVLSFNQDTDATGGIFTRYRDSNSVLGQVTAANGTQCSYGVSSDERLKENIVNASSQLDVINNIQVREFDWKVNGYHEVGMIAQELNTVVPSVVQVGGDDVSEQPWGVDYGKLTPYLIKAIQEQQTIIDDLKSRIETLEG